jgi:activating signal cointegrator 1
MMEITNVLSIWQPYASLAVHGFKEFETRSYPISKALLGQRIGIASTKRITAAQRALLRNETFHRFYCQTNLPELKDLSHGCLIGTVVVRDCWKIAQCHLEGVGGREKAFGDWAPGRYAWFLVEPEILAEPIPVRGQQRMWRWKE